MLATGGSKGELAVWDLSESKKIEQHFKGGIIAGSFDEKDYDPANPGNDEMDDAGPEKETDDFEDISDSEEEKEKEKKKKKKKDKKKKSK